MLNPLRRCSANCAKQDSAAQRQHFVSLGTTALPMPLAPVALLARLLAGGLAPETPFVQEVGVLDIRWRLDPQLLSVVIAILVCPGTRYCPRSPHACTGNGVDVQNVCRVDKADKCLDRWRYHNGSTTQGHSG